MKKILFPTDFSKSSFNAFAYAIHLAKRIGAEIITLHVYNFPEGIVTDAYENVLDNYDIRELGSFENYRSEVPKLREIAEKNQGNKVKLSHVLERGDAVDTILTVAAQNHIDFIVMGTNGASGIVEGLFGTVTEKVMNRANCQVLAVPVSCQYAPISKILFLTQFEQRHKNNLHKLIAFANLFNAHIDVLYVPLHHTEEEVETLREWRAEFKHEDVYFYIIGSDTLEETIMDFMELHRTNLLAMTVKRKGLFERLLYYSVASKMVFHSEVPVLSSRYE